MEKNFQMPTEEIKKMCEAYGISYVPEYDGETEPGRPSISTAIALICAELDVIANGEPPMGGSSWKIVSARTGSVLGSFRYKAQFEASLDLIAQFEPFDVHAQGMVAIVDDGVPVEQ